MGGEAVWALCEVGLCEVRLWALCEVRVCGPCVR